jgi:hypothetical protein
MPKKLKMFFIGLFYFIVSPIWVPAVILWEQRKQVKEFYIQCYQALTFKDVK